MGPFESLYLEKCTLPYSNYGIKCFVIYIEAKKMCKINKLNKLSLAADSFLNIIVLGCT